LADPEVCDDSYDAMTPPRFSVKRELTVEGGSRMEGFRERLDKWKDQDEELWGDEDARQLDKSGLEN
jgi:hypothetical protein